MPKSFKGWIEYIKFFGEWWSLMSGALAIPFGALALVVPGHPKTYFAVLAFVALLIAAGGLVKKIVELREDLRPKLRLACGPNVPESVRPNRWQGGSNIFFRIAIESDSTSPVHNCQGRLISIYGPHSRWDGDTAILTFAPGELDDSDKKTIHPDVTAHLDVLMFLFGPANNYLSIHAGTKDRHWRFVPSLSTIIDAHGIYVLKVQIVGDHMPTITRELEFNWRGPDNSELRLL